MMALKADKKIDFFAGPYVPSPPKPNMALPITIYIKNGIPLYAVAQKNARHFTFEKSDGNEYVCIGVSGFGIRGKPYDSSYDIFWNCGGVLGDHYMQKISDKGLSGDMYKPKKTLTIVNLDE